MSLGIPYAPASVRGRKPLEVCPICLAECSGRSYGEHYVQEHAGVEPSREQASAACARAAEIMEER